LNSPEKADSCAILHTLTPQQHWQQCFCFGMLEDMYRVYATTKNGEGRVTEIHRGSLEEFDLTLSLYAKDVVITFERMTEEEIEEYHR
jgi:hypothetical protein